ncbi:hypothetical protein V6Z12_D07G100900 [Gossypium hirsutum]
MKHAQSRVPEARNRRKKEKGSLALPRVRILERRRDRWRGYRSAQVVSDAHGRLAIGDGGGGVREGALAEACGARVAP